LLSIVLEGVVKQLGSKSNCVQTGKKEVKLSLFAVTVLQKPKDLELINEVSKAAGHKVKTQILLALCVVDETGAQRGLSGLSTRPC
jgi:hypothetical protein